MAEFILRFNSEEASLLEIAVVIFSIANLLQWCFFIMLIFDKLHNKKENASHRKKTRSRNTNWKRR